MLSEAGIENVSIPLNSSHQLRTERKVPFTLRKVPTRVSGGAVFFFFYCQQTTNDSYKFFTEEKKCLDNSGVHLAEMNGEGIKMLSSLRHPLKSRGERCRVALKISEQVLIASQVSECPKIIKDVGMTLLLV